MHGGHAYKLAARWPCRRNPEQVLGTWYAGSMHPSYLFIPHLYRSRVPQPQRAIRCWRKHLSRGRLLAGDVGYIQHGVWVAEAILDHVDFTESGSDVTEVRASFHNFLVGGGGGGHTAP